MKQRPKISLSEFRKFAFMQSTDYTYLSLFYQKILNINLFARLFLNKMFSFGAVNFTRIVFSLWKTGKSSEEYVIFGCTHD